MRQGRSVKDIPQRYSIPLSLPKPRRRAGDTPLAQDILYANVDLTNSELSKIAHQSMSFTMCIALQNMLGCERACNVLANAMNADGEPLMDEETSEALCKVVRGIDDALKGKGQ